MKEGRKTRVLIVEDELITAIAIEKSLIAKGYKVVGIVKTGEEAIELAVKENADLVLMDIKLKGGDGIAAAQKIHARLDVPIVYVTAYSDVETIKRAVHSRFYGYVVKPYNEDELYNVIEAALRRSKSKKE